MVKFTKFQHDDNCVRKEETREFEEQHCRRFVFWEAPREEAVRAMYGTADVLTLIKP
jgi:hypothetical protein